MDRDLWQQAQQLFIACADMPESARSEFLASHCGDNAALRELVETLLRGDREDDRARAAIGAMAEELAGLREDRWIGRQIGAFTIESRIAEGGMGIVYLARRSDEQFEQKVAVKLLATSLATEESRRRFLSERQFLANLQHPNIAMLLDGGETDEGVPYLVMEYIEGTPIDVYCREKHLPLDDMIALFRQVCSVVHYSHTNLVIHRDIKPSNIMVTAEGVPKLLDFGIAKLLEPGFGDTGAAVTMRGARLLTPRHASPEQVRGGVITTASDVYALGILLYELVSGKAPYEITTTMSPGETERVITTVQPPAPSDMAAGRMKHHLRGDLDTIVLKCLRKEPQARYQSALELAEDLQRFLENRPILARPPTRGYLLSRYWKRHRPALIGASAAAVALIAGTIAATVGFVEARKSERIATEQARTAEAISSYLVSIFQEAHPDTSAGREPSVREILEVGRNRVDDELADSPIVMARVLETLAGVYKGLADYTEAEALQQRVLSLVEEHAPDDHATIARVQNDLGDIYRIRSRHDEAVAMIRAALDSFERSGAGMSEEWADAISNLGLAYEESGQPGQAETFLLRAYEERQRLFEAPHEKLALSLHNLAWFFGRNQQPEAAERYALQAIAMREAVYGEIHPRVAATVSLLSNTYRDLDRWEDAEREARKSVAIAEQVFDTGHPDLTFPLYSLASILQARGELADAERLFAQIVAWERVSLGEDSHDYAMSLKQHASVLTELADYDAAEPGLREARAIFLALPAGSARSLYNAETDLGRVLVLTGRLAEAGEMLGVERQESDNERYSATTLASRRLAIAEYHLANGNPDAALAQTAPLLDALDKGAADDYLAPDILYTHALGLRAGNDSRAALQLLQRALDRLIARWGPGHWRAGVIRAELGRAQLDNGDLDAGLRSLESGHTVLTAALGTEHPETVRAAQSLATLAPPAN